MAAPDSDGIYIILGNRLDQIFDQFAEGVVNRFIPDLLEIIAPCLFLYFLVKGWMIMSGRSRDAFSDLIMQVGIMSFLLAIGLSTAQTFNYAQEAFNWVQSVLLRAMPTMDGQSLATLNTWAWLQSLWDYMYEGFVEGINLIWDELNPTDIGYMILLGIIAVLGIFAGGYFLFAISTIFIINKIVITILVAFSPVFFALGIFPVTREFFSNWAKTALVYIFSLVLVLVVGWMFADIFRFYLKDLYDLVQAVNLNQADDSIDGMMAAFGEIAGAIALMAFILGFVIKQIPALSQGLVGKFIGAGALTTTGASMIATTQGIKQMRQTIAHPLGGSLGGTKKSGNSDKDSEKKAQQVADTANSGGSAGLKAAAGLMGGAGLGAAAVAAKAANSSSGTPGNGGGTSGFTTATPISQFAQGHGGGTMQFDNSSSATAGSAPSAGSITPKGDSSMPSGSGTVSIQAGNSGSMSGASGTSTVGMTASYSAPSSSGQFTAGAQSFKATSGPSASSTGVSGTMTSGYDLNAGSGLTLSKDSQINAANLPTGPNSTGSARNVSGSGITATGAVGVAGVTGSAGAAISQAINSANANPSGATSPIGSISTPGNPGQAQAVNVANGTAPAVHAGGGTIFSTAKAQTMQAAKTPSQGGLNVSGSGFATIHPAGLGSLRQAARNNQGLNALNQNQSSPDTSPGISSTKDNSNK